MADSTDNQGPSSEPARAVLRDVLGGDEGKRVLVNEAVAPNEPLAPLPPVSAPTPATAEPKTPAVPNEKAAEPATPVRSAIRTLHSDVARTVQQNDVSVTKIALAQQEKNARLGYVGDEDEGGGFWSAWSIGTIILVIAGVALIAGAVAFVVLSNISIPFVSNEPAPAPTLVPVERQERFDATRTTRVDLMRAIDAFIEADYTSPVALEALIIEELTTIPATTPDDEPTTETRPIDIERFLNLIGSRAPGRFVRSLEPTFTLGRAGGTPFVMAKATSYETAFAGMLEWEQFVADDLVFIAKQPTTDPLDGFDKLTAGRLETGNSQQTAETSEMLEMTLATTSTTTATVGTTTDTASATSSEVAPLAPSPLPLVPKPMWKDIIVNNQDVRALVAHDGSIVVLYAFVKDATLVITRTREALVLIINAMNAPVFGA